MASRGCTGLNGQSCEAYIEHSQVTPRRHLQLYVPPWVSKSLHTEYIESLTSTPITHRTVEKPSETAGKPNLEDKQTNLDPPTTGPSRLRLYEPASGLKTQRCPVVRCPQAPIRTRSSQRRACCVLELFASELIFGLCCGAYSPQQNHKEVHDTGVNQLPTPSRFATLAFSARNRDSG